ncbi:MAG: radical SAM protein [Peptococcaceae bacterium]|nr:radical SAM protein [Peptococcaceae bacterium]
MSSLLGMLNPQNDIVKPIVNEVVSKRIPLTGTFELTRRCNFSCLYCYQQNCRHTEELTTKEWTSIIDQITDAGCKFVNFTGGEPLLRDDFERIYEYAFNKGLLLRIKTNGSLISTSHIELWRRLPPVGVSISLYGKSPETYKNFCGVESAYETVMGAIAQLKTNHIEVYTTFVAGRHNYKDTHALYDMVSGMGVPFHLFSNLTPCDNGDLRPLEESLPIEERSSLLKWFYAKQPVDWDAVSSLWVNNVRRCFAGLAAYHVVSTGEMILCPMAPAPSFPVYKGGFLKAWGKLYEARLKLIEVETKCGRCGHRAVCGMCAPNIDMRSSKGEPPKEHCLNGKRLHQMLRQEGILL